MVDNLVDPSYELLDPCPDIFALFIEFNDRYFKGELSGCEVKWSPRMTTCAGVCSYDVRGGLCSVRLSKPLLSLRPRKDLVETMLHEMIHAYLFVTKRFQDRDGHGPEFQSHMHRINNLAGTNITIYHTFHREVAEHKRHWWKCNGPCQHRGPFMGLVKRAMNRAPGPNDLWWADHQSKCGGKFMKIKEPETKKKVPDNKGKKTTGSNPLPTYFTKTDNSPNKVSNSGAVTAFAGTGLPTGIAARNAPTHNSNTLFGNNTGSVCTGQTLGGTGGRSKLLDLFSSSSGPTGSVGKQNKPSVLAEISTDCSNTASIKEDTQEPMDTSEYQGDENCDLIVGPDSVTPNALLKSDYPTENAPSCSAVLESDRVQPPSPLWSIHFDESLDRIGVDGLVYNPNSNGRRTISPHTNNQLDRRDQYYQYEETLFWRRNDRLLDPCYVPPDCPRCTRLMSHILACSRPLTQRRALCHECFCLLDLETMPLAERKSELARAVSGASEVLVQQWSQEPDDCRDKHVFCPACTRFFPQSQHH